MQTLASILKETRSNARISLEEIQSKTGIDKALISKIERGVRLPTLEQLRTLSNYYNLGYKDLKNKLLAHKVVKQISSEEEPIKILQAAEEQILYETVSITRKDLQRKIETFFSLDRRINKAWLFGSWARNEAGPESDIDLMIEYEADSEISLFDEIEIQHKLSEETGIRVDLVEKDMIKPFAKASIEAEKIMIYEKKSL